MDNASAQCLHLLERSVHVVGGEVGQRDPVAGAGAALMDTDSGLAGLRLPAAALSLATVGELDAEQT